MRLIINLIVSSIAVFIAANMLPGVHVDSFGTALIVAVVLGVVNVIVKPILFVLTLPITLLTLGLFALVLNAFMIEITAFFVKGFKVESFWWALLFSIVLSLINWFLNRLAKE